MTSTQHVHRAAPGPAPCTGARRLRGVVLVAGAVLVGVLVESGALSRLWFPLGVGLTYLAAAAVGRSRSTLWTPGIVLSAAGLTLGLWLTDGRPVDSYQLLALSLLSLGAGGVLVALLAQRGLLVVTPMSLALTTLLLGAFELLDQQRVGLPFGRTVPYLLLLGAWGLVELLRPAGR